MNQPTTHSPLLLYDGHCFLCSKSAKFVQHIDKKKKIGFLALQSSEAQKILVTQKHPLKDLDTVLLHYNNQLFKKSDAVLEVFRIIGGGWKLFLCFRIIPRPWRDVIYDFVARNRYRWFGRKESCDL